MKKIDEREIDRRVAKEVFGCKAEQNQTGVFVCTCEGYVHSRYAEIIGKFRIKPYSSDIRFAWEIIDKLGYPVIIEMYKGNYEVDFIKGVNGRESVCAESNSAPMAICLAALKVKSK